MRKTFCDRCKAECVNTVGRFNGYVEHTTSGGEQVGMDEMKQVELCRICTNIACELLGIILQPRELEKALENTYEGGAARGFDNITVSDGDAHYVGPDSPG